MNSLILLVFLIPAVGGRLILFHYYDIYAQSTYFQLPSLSFSTPYSDMPTNMQDSLSELGAIDEEVDSQVNEIIKPTFQNPLEKSETKNNDELTLPNHATGNEMGGDDLDAPTTATRSSGGGSGDVYVVDYSNIRI